MLTFPEKAYSNLHIPAPKKRESLIMKGLIFLGMVFFVLFVWWFFRDEHIGNPLLFYLLGAALLFRLIRLAHEWYHYWGISVPELPVKTRDWTVDMLTTYVPGEPYEMTLTTLEAMVNVTYPHTTYLCDEGDDPYLRQKCEEMGVVHVTRTEKVNAKAGNINNALKKATGEIAVVLDPDHIPAPNFLDRVLPYFQDPEIGYVQCVQAYYNQNDSLIAKAAAEQTYHFYGPMMMSMNKYGTAQAIGANCTFRRAALDSIGGHAAGLSEDMHTAMQLHAKGWKSIYTPEALTRGLAPATLSSFYKQQLKWSRGTFELLFFSFPKLMKGFTWRQMLHYSTLPLYFLYGLIGLIDLAVPATSLFMAEVPWEVELGQLFLVAGPLIFISMVIRQYAQRWLLEESERGFHFLGGILLMGTWWVFLLGFIYTLFRIKVPYIPTPKEGESENAIKLSLPNLGVILISLMAIIYGLQIDYTPYTFLMAGFSGFNILLLSMLFLISQQKFVREFRYKYNLKKPTDRIRGLWWEFRHRVIYPIFRQRAVFTTLIFLFGGGWYLLNLAAEKQEIVFKKSIRDVGQFYTGIDLSENRNEAYLDSFDLVIADHYEMVLDHDNIVSISDSGASLVFRWSRSPEQNAALTYQNILDGVYDEFLNEYTSYLNELSTPAFMIMDLPDSSLQGPNADGVSRALVWEHMYHQIAPYTTNTVGWIWKTSPDLLTLPQPDHQYIDWYEYDVRGITDTAELFAGLRNLDSLMRESYLFSSRPVFLSGMSEEIASIYQDSLQLFRDLSTSLTRYRGHFVTSDSKSAFLAVLPWDQHPSGFSPEIKWSDPYPTPAGLDMVPDNPAPETPLVQGVCYNPESDWRDGHCPLTRRQLESDFEAIQNMGAAYIRRFAPSVYDQNLLNIAEEYGINVYYGFDFSTEIDYYVDQEAKQAYLREIRECVSRFQSESIIKAWVLGDEQWNRLSESFSPPYLNSVRKAYFDFINDAAALIHTLQPGAVVIAPFTLDPEMETAAAQLFAAGDVDWIGVNVYSPHLLPHWKEVIQNDPLQRKWICTGFGPRSHANRATTEMTNLNQPIEPSPLEKSRDYLHTWDALRALSDPQLMGGLAFCWRDRMDGTLSWYGLTDTKGYKKRSYRALAEKWTGSRDTSSLKNLVILSPTQSIQPGNWYEFRAISPSAPDPDITIEWSLRPEGQLQEVGKIANLHDGQTGKIGFPKTPGLYRVYARLSHPSGESLTASVPVRVGAGTEPPEESWWQKYVRLIQ